MQTMNRRALIGAALGLAAGALARPLPSLAAGAVPGMTSGEAIRAYHAPLAEAFDARRAFLEGELTEVWQQALTALVRIMNEGPEDVDRVRAASALVELTMEPIGLEAGYHAAAREALQRASTTLWVSTGDGTWAPMPIPLGERGSVPFDQESAPHLRIDIRRARPIDKLRTIAYYGWYAIDLRAEREYGWVTVSSNPHTTTNSAGSWALVYQDLQRFLASPEEWRARRDLANPALD